MYLSMKWITFVLHHSYLKCKPGVKKDVNILKLWEHSEKSGCNSWRSLKLLPRVGIWCTEFSLIGLFRNFNLEIKLNASMETRNIV